MIVKSNPAPDTDPDHPQMLMRVDGRRYHASLPLMPDASRRQILRASANRQPRDNEQLSPCRRRQRLKRCADNQVTTNLTGPHGEGAGAIHNASHHHWRRPRRSDLLPMNGWPRGGPHHHGAARRRSGWVGRLPIADTPSTLPGKSWNTCRSTSADEAIPSPSLSSSVATARCRRSADEPLRVVIPRDQRLIMLLPQTAMTIPYGGVARAVDLAVRIHTGNIA